MNAAKKIILLLWLVLVASLGNASALTPGASENRVWQKSFETLETRQAEPLQTLGGHQENGSAGYDYAVDSLLAAENRLVSQTSLTNGPAGSKFSLAFAYDSKSRRIQKTVSTNSGSGYVAQYTNRFAYDGWNLLAILNPASSVTASFLWGSDLSSSMQGAGGVGGLLEVTDYGSSTTNCFTAFDGNGNVSALINAANGSVLAQYEYGPFGELIRKSGPFAAACPFRFSTKYQDDESDLLYYGYRYYNPSTGRWMSRDPASENGGCNLYVNCGNELLTKHDGVGLFTFNVEYHPNTPSNSVIWGGIDSWGLTRATDRSYSPDHTDIGNCVQFTVKAKASYDVYYVEGIDPTLDKSAAGTTVEMHETVHVGRYNTPLIDFESKFDNAKFCCKSYCIREFNEWMEASFKVALAQGNYDSNNYDLSGEYDPNNSLLPEIRRRAATYLTALNNAKQTEAAAERAFDDCKTQHAVSN